MATHLEEVHNDLSIGWQLLVPTTTSPVPLILAKTMAACEFRDARPHVWLGVDSIPSDLKEAMEFGVLMS
mgnify:CR=1 FL=1